MHNLVPSLNVVMASVNLENVDVLYIENGNVDRPVLKTNRNHPFSQNTFLV